MTKPFQYKSYFMSIDFLKQTGDIIYSSDISFSQGDYGTSFIKFELKNDDKIIDLNGYRVVVSIVRKNMTKVVTESTIIDASNGLIEIPLTRSVLCIGTNQIEICLQKDQTQLISPIIPYKVTKSIGENSIEDLNNSNEYPILIQLIEDVKSLKSSTEAFLTDAQSSESSRQQNENTRVSQEEARQESMRNIQETFDNKVSEVDSKISEVNTTKEQMVSTVNSKVTEVDNAKNNMVSTVDTKVKEFENKFEELQNQNVVTEIEKARDGEKSLADRLERDLKKWETIFKTVEGNHLSLSDTVDSFAKNIEIKGSTVQNPSNLADIKSVGDRIEGQELYRIPIKCTGKNLYGGTVVKNSVWTVDFKPQTSEGYNRSEVFTLLNSKEVSISYNGVSIEGNIMWFDVNKKFISQVFTKPFIPPSNAKYCCFYWSNARFPYVGDELQIEFGNKITSFSKYQEHKMTILSPVQLEKVGDVKDRIIEKDGVWGVEKNITHYTLNGSNCVIYKSEANAYTNIVRFWISDSANPNMNIKENQSVICDRFKSHGNSLDVDEEGVANTNGIDIHILKSKLASEDVIGFNKYLSENNTTLIYQANAPQFIPLPDNQQIKLQAFANQTNISFLTEVEGTIKADVPKSLGASVSSNTQAIQDLNKDLEKVKRLEEATTTLVTTESNFVTVEETNNGYFEDIKLEGKTLVNRLGQKELDKMGRTYSYDNSSKTLTNNNGIDNTSWNDVPSLLNNLSIGREYTFIYEGVTNQTEVQICSESLSVKYLPSVNKGERKVYKFLADGTQFKLKVFGNSSVSISNIMLIEGNLSKNPPNTHFEGIKSVGDNTDRLEIISSKGRVISFEQGSLHSGTGVLVPSSTRITSKEFSKSNDGYTDIVGIDTSKYQIIIFDFDENFNYLGDYGLREWSRETRVKLLPNARYYKFCVKINDESNIKPNEFKTIITTGKRDIKNILYKDKDNTWKKPILREWDSIEKHSDGKYYYHKRGSVKTFKGSSDENWIISSSGTNQKLFMLQLNDLMVNKNNTDAIIICDKLNSVSSDYHWTHDGNFITVGFDTNYVRIKLEGKNTLDEVKQWLQNNPITIVYPLAQEKIYECTPIDLITFENETNYSINCGAIKPKTTLKCVNYIGNVINTLKEKVSYLEDRLYGTNLANFTVALNALDTKLKLEQLSKTLR